MFDDLPLDEARKDPARYIPQVEEKQQKAKENLRGVSAILKELRKIEASHEHLKYIQTHGVPRPREASGQRSDANGPGPEEAPGTAEGISRREQVCRLLGQQPTRAWKVKDIAAALRIDNVKSLRTSLDDFVRSGVIKKDVENSTYFLGSQGYQGTF